MKKYLKILTIAILLFIGIAALTYNKIEWYQLVNIPALFIAGYITKGTKFI